MIKANILLLIIFSLFGEIIYAQTFKLNGIVCDLHSGEKIENAVICLKDSISNQIIARTYTNENGVFSLYLLRPLFCFKRWYLKKTKNPDNL